MELLGLFVWDVQLISESKKSSLWCRADEAVGLIVVHIGGYSHTRGVINIGNEA